MGGPSQLMFSRICKKSNATQFKLVGNGQDLDPPKTIEGTNICSKCHLKIHEQREGRKRHHSGIMICCNKTFELLYDYDLHIRSDHNLLCACRGSLVLYRPHLHFPMRNVEIPRGLPIEGNIEPPLFKRRKPTKKRLDDAVKQNDKRQVLINKYL